MLFDDRTTMAPLDIRGREVPVSYTKSGLWVASLPSGREVTAKTRKDLYVKLLQGSRNDVIDASGHWTGLFQSG